jgi:hypothetical protein
MTVYPIATSIHDYGFDKHLITHINNGVYIDFKNGTYSYSYERKWLSNEIRNINYNSEKYYIFYGSNDEHIVTNEKLETCQDTRVFRSLISSKVVLDGCFLTLEYGRKRRNIPSIVRSYHDLSLDPIAKKEFRFYKYVKDEHCLIALDARPKQIFKFDKQLNFKWQREFPHDHMHGSVKEDLLDYNDTVITNLGIADRDKKEDGEIIALLKETGETKWSFKYDAPIHSCALIQDRVYLTSFNQWLILDAETGSIVLEGDSGLNVDEDGAVSSSLWSDGEFLYFSSVWGKKIRIFHESTGEYHGDIDKPHGFIISTRSPISLNGFHYFDLGAGASKTSNPIGCYYGALITSTEEIRKGPPFNIEIEENHNFTINTLEQEKGQAYEIVFDEPELGHILRFGRIEAQKIAFANTYNTLASLSDDYGKHINKQFNGQIVFKINEKTLQKPIDDKQLAEKLNLLCTLVNKHCEQYIAPNAKESVKASWQWV